MKKYNETDSACWGAVIGGVVGCIVAACIMAYVQPSFFAAIVICLMVASPTYGGLIFQTVAKRINHNNEKKVQDKIDFDNFLIMCRGKK